MSLQSVTVHLPTGLYNRLKRRADQAHRTIESEMLETVAGAIPADDGLTPELSEAVARLSTADDETLLRQVRARFPLEKSAQLEELHLRRETGAWSERDARQAALLATELEHFMFSRAQAMSLLLQRGYEITALTAG